MTEIASEGLVLVSSSTGRDIAGGGFDTGTTTQEPGLEQGRSPESSVKSTDTAKAGRTPAGKEEGHVADALRTAYQRTVDEAIPSEMLDLLRKLD